MPPRPFEYGDLLAPLLMPPCPSQSPAELDAWRGARAGKARPSLYPMPIALSKAYLH